MLKQERRVQIALNAFTVWHNVPAVFKCLLDASVCLVVVLTGAHMRVNLFHPFQPA